MLTIKPLEEYFERHGINAIPNTLGHTDDLVDAYIAETQHIVDKSELKHSNHMKLRCYNQFYNFDERKKFTGFESFEKEDKSFRIEMANYVCSPQFSPTRFVEKCIDAPSVSYKDQLGNFLSNIELPKLLYLSGGIDSELVARVLIDNDIEFTPVIFQWVNNEGNIKNYFDIRYALKFCEKFNIKPIIRTIDVETLWQSQEFRDLAIETQHSSPQVNTYVQMINLMNKEMPDHYHLLGGEVRYRSNFLKDDNTEINLVQMGKVIPVPYNGIMYSAQSDISGSTQQVSRSLIYRNDGTFTVTGAAIELDGVPDAGNWAVAPLWPSGYEYRIVSVVEDHGSGQRTRTPSSAPTAFAPIGSSTTLCRITAGNNGFLNPGSTQVTFTIEVRPIGGPGLATSTIVFFGASSQSD